MLRNRCVWALVMVMLVMGCGAGAGKSAIKGKAEQTSAIDKAKIALEDVVKTGQVGSGLDDVRTYLEEVKKTDAGKATPLIKELETLQSKPGTPDEAKAKAKELMGKL